MIINDYSILLIIIDDYWWLLMIIDDYFIMYISVVSINGGFGLLFFARIFRKLI